MAVKRKNTLKTINLLENYQHGTLNKRYLISSLEELLAELKSPTFDGIGVE
tara:strand:+ start:389 stop:541 length:153 start_codon:yes stop_codon:yes gene_type:complete